MTTQAAGTPLPPPSLRAGAFRIVGVEIIIAEEAIEQCIYNGKPHKVSTSSQFGTPNDALYVFNASTRIFLLPRCARVGGWVGVPAAGDSNRF